MGTKHGYIIPNSNSLQWITSVLSNPYTAPILNLESLKILFQY